MPLTVRVAMAHAVVQTIAEEGRIDVLHIKGAALDPSLVWPGRPSNDADVLVRPSHTTSLLHDLQRHGFETVHTFRTSSSFEHSATVRHPQWGYVDVHRYFPGIGLDAEAAFDALWGGRQPRPIASLNCSVPALPAQALILLLHAARGGGSPRAHADVDAAWWSAPEPTREEVLALVDTLDAYLAFAAALGDLDRYRGERGYQLWRVASQGGTRIEDWAARVRAAPSPLAALHTALRAPLVNTDHLANLLGRRPTGAEVVREFFARPRRGVSEQWQALRQRSGRRHR